MRKVCVGIKCGAMSHASHALDAFPPSREGVVGGKPDSKGEGAGLEQNLLSHFFVVVLKKKN